MNDKRNSSQSIFSRTERITTAMFEYSPDMLAILDADGHILDCNKQLANNLLYEKKDLIGVTGLTKLVFNEDRDIALQAFEEVKKTSIKHNVSLRMKRKDNSVFPSIWSGVVLKDETDQLEGYLVTGKDVTDTHKLQERLIEAKKQHITEKLALVGELSSRLAHDLRNPLSIIQTSIENLKLMYEIDEKKQKQFDKIERAIFRMSHQLKDVLDFVGEQPIKFERIKFSHVISEALESLRIPSNVKLVLPNNDLKILCDKTQFSIAINNLILNGIQAIQNKGMIAIGIDENKDGIIIEIEDSGKGIPKKDIQKVFMPLFTTKQTGTGLGLVSVKSIVEAHKGTISVTSPPTKFRIFLPK